MDVQNGALTLMFGGPERVPFAPLTLTEFSSNGSVENAGAFAVVSGGFVSSAQTDLMALGSSNPAPVPVRRRRSIVGSVPHVTEPG